MNLYCPWEPAEYFFFSANVPPMLYYALIPGMIVSILFSILLFRKNRHNLSIRNLIYISTLFFAWGLFALILFATNNPDQVMFYWSLTILVETLIYLIAVHFTYNFLKNKKLTFNQLLLTLIPILPVIFLLSTKYNLSGVNLADCTAIEGPIALYYSYAIELLYLIVVIVLIIKEYLQTIEIKNKQKIRYFGIGICLFLLTFSSGNIIGSFTDDWVLSQVGYFGMPIFIGFLVYIIVKYEAFSVKLIATQALVWSLTILIGSQFLFIKTPINFLLTGISFISVIIFGQILIKSVKKEIDQREKLEVLTGQLSDANEKLKSLDLLKTEFVSLASHQLRSPLTAIKGYTSMILEGDYGEISPKVKEVVEKVMESSNNLTLVVEDLLDVSKIESGGMKYVMENFDFGQMVKETIEELSIVSEKKGLKLTYNIPSDRKYIVSGDKEKLRQIIINLVDNSMKYTKQGGIDVTLKSENKSMILSIKDTGIGVAPEVASKLFQKFSRGSDGAKVNTSGSGLGLYIVREIIEAHKGRVWVESEGVGKGSTFFVEINEA